MFYTLPLYSRGWLTQLTAFKSVLDILSTSYWTWQWVEMGSLSSWWKNSCICWWILPCCSKWRDLQADYTHQFIWAASPCAKVWCMQVIQTKSSCTACKTQVGETSSQRSQNKSYQLQISEELKKRMVNLKTELRNSKQEVAKLTARLESIREKKGVNVEDLYKDLEDIMNERKEEIRNNYPPNSFHRLF